MTTFETKAQATDELAALYERVHPEYDGLLDHWRFCYSTYMGGEQWFSENIHRYYKEGEEEYADRIKRASRFNHTREVVDLIQKYIFKSPVKRDESASPEIKAFWLRATRAGQDIDQFMSEVSSASAICQRVAVVIDTTAMGGEGARSVAEAKESGRDIYAYIVMPWDILDYSWNKTDGLLNWIKLREWVRNDEDPLADGEMIERRRLWTRDGWMLFQRRIVTDPKNGGSAQESVELVEQGFHNLGEVPVRLVDHATVNSPFRASGLVDDVAYLDRKIANYLSNIDAIIQDQTFSQLAIPAEALPADQTGAKNNMLEMSTKRAFTYHAGIGSTAKPEFISPDPKQAGVIRDTINMIITQIYSTIGLAGERTKQDNAVGIDNSSGVAKAYDFERINSLLLSKSKRLQKVENWLARMVKVWNGEKIDQDPDLVTYPDSFDIATLGDELVTAEALLKVEAPIEIRREHMKEVVAKLLPSVKDEKWQQIMTSIDKWEPEPKVVNLPGAKPGSGSKPAAAQPRQGSVTPETKSTPKNQAK